VVKKAPGVVDDVAQVDEVDTHDAEVKHHPHSEKEVERQEEQLETVVQS
jgi:Asp-tRNA(Asn)/Glu-tRNA(Gln) amidotransferase C subunit